MILESESKNEAVSQEIRKFISSRFNLDEFGFIIVILSEDEEEGACISPSTTLMEGSDLPYILRKIADVYEENGGKFGIKQEDGVMKQ